MSDIFRRSTHRRMREAGEAAPVVGYDKPTGGASKDLSAPRGGPSSSFQDPAEEELRKRREEQERIRQEAIARERAKRQK
jgi:hypothetical protein